MKYFHSEKDCLKNYKENKLDIHSYIWIKAKDNKQKTTIIKSKGQTKKYIVRIQINKQNKQIIKYINN